MKVLALLSAIFCLAVALLFVLPALQKKPVTGNVSIQGFCSLLFRVAIDGYRVSIDGYKRLIGPCEKRKAALMSKWPFYLLPVESSLCFDIHFFGVC